MNSTLVNFLVKTLLPIFLKLLLVYYIYMIIGTLALGVTFSSYVILEYIKTTGESIFTISIKDISGILSVFQTESNWIFFKSFIQNIIYNLPFSDTFALGETLPNTGNIFSPLGIMVEYIFRVITGKGFATQAERIQLWTELLPGFAKAALATLFFKLLLTPKKIIEKSNKDIGLKIFLSVFFIFLYVYFAIASFYVASAIIECIAVEFKDNVIILYIFYYLVLILCLLLNAKVFKTFLWKLLLDVAFSFIGSILLYFLCDQFIAVNWANLTFDDQVFLAIVLFAIHFTVTCLFFLAVDQLKSWIESKEKTSITLSLFKKK